jgi:FeS assembly SUF system regulator
MIKLSRLTDYAVSLLTQMVKDGKSLSSASELAENTGLTLPTTSKILKQLAKSGLLTAQRGATGGYSFTRSAQDISIAAIIEAMDGPIALTDCAEGADRECHVEAICPMSGHWDKVNRAIKRALEDVSLAEMATASHESESVSSTAAEPNSELRSA